MAWNAREPDRRLETLEELRRNVTEERERAREAVFPMREITLGEAHGELALVEDGSAAPLTHGAFVQLCDRATAAQGVKPPREWLASLPPALAAADLNHALAQLKKESRLLLRAGLNGVRPVLRGLTAPGYERRWNVEVLEALEPLVREAGMTPLALYLGERDMHVYLIDTDLSTGLVAWSSETGHTTRAQALPFVYDRDRGACLLARGRHEALDVMTMTAMSVGDTEDMDEEM